MAPAVYPVLPRPDFCSLSLQEGIDKLWGHQLRKENKSLQEQNEVITRRLETIAAEMDEERKETKKRFAALSSAAIKLQVDIEQRKQDAERLREERGSMKAVLLEKLAAIEEQIAQLKSVSSNNAVYTFIGSSAASSRASSANPVAGKFNFPNTTQVSASARLPIENSKRPSSELSSNPKPLLASAQPLLLGFTQTDIPNNTHTPISCSASTGQLSGALEIPCIASNLHGTNQPSANNCQSSSVLDSTNKVDAADKVGSISTNNSTETSRPMLGGPSIDRMPQAINFITEDPLLSSGPSTRSRRKPLCSPLKPQRPAKSTRKNKATSLKQRHASLQNFYRTACTDFQALQQPVDQSTEIEFVEKFLQGMTYQKARDILRNELVQTHRSRVREAGKIEIICTFKDVGEALKSAGLVPK